MRHGCIHSIGPATLALMIAGCFGESANEETVMQHEFSWVIENQLAGMPRPGTDAAVVDDIAFLERQGISLLVSLTEDVPGDSALADRGIESWRQLQRRSKTVGASACTAPPAWGGPARCWLPTWCSVEAPPRRQLRRSGNSGRARSRPRNKRKRSRPTTSICNWRLETTGRTDTPSGRPTARCAENSAMIQLHVPACKHVP